MAVIEDNGVSNNNHLWIDTSTIFEAPLVRDTGERD